MTKALDAVVNTGKEVTIDPATPRGTYVSCEQLEQALEIKRTDVTYALHLMRIKTAFHAATAAAGDRKMMKIEGGGLRVLTDPEAVEYTDTRYSTALHQAVAIHERGKATVRVDELSEEERARYDHQSSIRDRQTRAIREMTAEIAVRNALMPGGQE